jgi:hypothetical protein
MTIGLNDFRNQAYSGYGASTQAEADGLSKALEAGFQQGPGQTGGSALRVESLESSLKVVTYTSSHIKFWKKIPKSPAYSTVEEYNQLTDYGANQNPFVQEGELPQATDTSYIRRTQLIKFLGTTREVTHQATLVHPAHGDIIALENQNGILWLLEQIERNLFQGDSSLSFDGEAEQWDGLDALIDPTSVIDMQGNTLQEADLEEAGNEIIENFGFPTDMYLGTRSMSDLVKTLYPRERIQLPAPMNGQIGNSIQTIATQAGVIEFNPEVFIQRAGTAPGAPTSPNAPASPASIGTALDAAATAGDHAKGSPSGTTNVNYLVTASNRFGESAASGASAGVVQAAINAMTAGEKAAGNDFDLTITNAAAIGAFPPEYFNVYRSNHKTAAGVPTAFTDYSLILKVPAASQLAGGVTTVDDVNLNLPFTSVAYFGELTPSVLTFRQLMPMMKMDLAVLAPAYRWMILLYGTPLMFAPLKWLRFINIGELSVRG